MRQVATSPQVSANDWFRLGQVLRDHAESINQAASGNLFPSVSVATTYSAGSGDLVIYVVPSGTFTVTLPLARDMQNKKVTVKRANNTTHTITIQGASGNIDGAASVTLTTAYQARTFHSDGTNYWGI